VFSSVVLLIPWASPPSVGCSKRPTRSAIPNGSATGSAMSSAASRGQGT
jgi:hypothetical protein